MKNLIYSSFFLVLATACSKDNLTFKNTIANFALYDQYIYAASGTDGLTIIDIATKEVVRTIAPKGKLKSIDDVTIADNILFALDAVGKGFVATYSLTNPTSPAIVVDDFKIPTNPFCGISAHDGEVIVSGGIKCIAMIEYQNAATLNRVDEIFGDRGHPEVTLSDDGKVGFVSTHYRRGQFEDGFEYGVISVSTSTNEVLDRIGLEGAGDTPGGGSPASWPVRVAQQGNKLFCAEGNGLSILSVGDEGELSLNQSIPLPISGVDVAVDENNAYVVGLGTSPQLLILDISNFDNVNILEARMLADAARPTSVEVTNDKIIIAGNEAGIIILDK